MKLKWWKHELDNIEGADRASSAVADAQSRLDETLAIEDRVHSVTESLTGTVKTNHFSVRIRRAYGQTYGQAQGDDHAETFEGEPEDDAPDV